MLGTAVFQKMTQKDYILQELKELNSSLINLSRQNIYSVPDGYFDNLSTQVLKRINDLEFTEEADLDTPLFNSLSKETLYTVPVGYFDNLAENALNTIREGNNYLPKESLTLGQTAKEELVSLSPLLSGLKKENLYTVPAGYFDNLAGNVVFSAHKPAKVISLASFKGFRYAAAAVVTTLIVLSGFLYFGKSNSAVEPGSRVMAKITRDIKNMDIAQQDDLFDFIDAGLNGKESALSKKKNKSTEIKDMLIGISEEELIDFKEQSEDIQAVLLIN